MTSSKPTTRYQDIRHNVADIKDYLARGGGLNQTNMDSKLANESRKALVASAKRLTHEERLRTFVRHSKLVMDLAEAARLARTKSRGGD